MIRPYLRDLINEHKLTTESNNEENKEMKKIIATPIVQNGKFN